MWGSSVVFEHPEGIALSPRGDVFVTDSRKHRVFVFRPDGTLVRQWGSKGTTSDVINFPAGIAVSVLGEVFVGDSAHFANRLIQVFAEDGTFRRQFLLPGAVCLYMLNLTLRPNGSLLVSDGGQHCVSQFV